MGFIEYSGIPESGSYKSRPHFKNYFYIGILLGILIYGVSFLLLTIENFQLNVRFLQFNKPGNYASPSRRSEFNKKIPFSNEIYNSHILAPKFKSIQWISEPDSRSNDKGAYVIKQEHDDGFKVVVKSMDDEEYSYVLIDKSTFTYNHIEYDIDDYIASPDLKSVILKTNVTGRFRHSTLALYWILNIEHGKIHPVYNDQDLISTVSWSPDSSNIVFIYNNNIYLKNIQADSVKQITSDGSTQLFNGKPDWVYEEEVFGSDIVLWWSPNGNKFTFLRSNNTQVPEFTIPYYTHEGNQDYPEISKVKYPKAGYPNPIVDVLTYDLTSEKLDEHALKSHAIKPKDRLITEVVWIGESILVKTTNRASNKQEIFLIDEKNVDLIRSEHVSNSWFEISSNTIFVPKNKTLGRKYDGYIDTVIDAGYNHLAYFSPPENPDGKLLTQGNWEVVNGVEAFDYTNNQVYFTSTMKSSIERHVHSINLLDHTNDGLPYIKDITTKEGWYDVSFSSGARFLYLSDRGPGVPTQRINDLKMNKHVITIEDNRELTKKLTKYDIPQIKYETIELQDQELGDTFLVNCKVTYPLHFDQDKKYPVLFFIYGGPGSQQVTKQWSTNSFSSVVAAELDTIVVTVDGRGTGYNNLNFKLGSYFKFIVRDQLGKYEAKDMISAGKLFAQRSYVDPERIAIWGWSYGGYLTLKTLESDVPDSVFSYGVAIAPVTNWKLYDTIYTERYMDTPEHNPIGYTTSSIHNYTNFAHVKRFFVGHGSGDDNVHLQHSLKLIDGFNLNNIENFEFMIFPDSNHAINYHNGNKIVYDRILEFFKKAFDWKFI
ncbi:Dipeptidyl aminopeptidase B [Spathaspora sp. JA1]|nr:Dipeptidyl aminopeptidase B [Spathaspora sp. JA1]